MSRSWILSWPVCMLGILAYISGPQPFVEIPKRFYEDHLYMLLSDLPRDAFLEICMHLEYKDVVSLSGSCSFLRDVLNIDIVWKRLVCGDPAVLGRLRPVPDDGPLPPSCHQRQLCLRRARLLNNFRNQRFMKISTTNNFVHCCTHENYLFAIDFKDDSLVVKVFRFSYQEVSPGFVLRPPKAIHGCSVITACQVVGDKLVVRQDELFSVYQIAPPPAVHFPLLRSIDVRHGPSTFHVTLVGNLVFSKNDSNRTTCVWDIDSGLKLGPLSSKVQDSDLAMIGHSSKLGAVLFSSRESERSQTAFEYSIALKAFTDFSVSVDSKETKIVGLISDKYNTIVIPKFDIMRVCVYDRIRSVLVSKREFETICYVGGELFTFHDNLVFPSPFGLKITRLHDLEIMWEIIYDDVNDYELPMLTYVEYRHLNIASALHLVVVSTNKCVSFWDCQLRRKLFALPPGCTDICLNDACTKLIFQMRERLCVWTFGEASSD